MLINNMIFLTKNNSNILIRLFSTTTAVKLNEIAVIAFMDGDLRVIMLDRQIMS